MQIITFLFVVHGSHDLLPLYGEEYLWFMQNVYTCFLFVLCCCYRQCLVFLYDIYNVLVENLIILIHFFAGIKHK